MEMEPRYDPGAVEARWLGRREPGSVLPVGSAVGPGPAEPRDVVSDIFDRYAAMGGREPADVDVTALSEFETAAEPGGVDAFRFGIALLYYQKIGRKGDRKGGHRIPSPPSPTDETPPGECRFERARHFLNKLWHASRYALLRLRDGSPAEEDPPAFEDRWILSRLHRTVHRVGESMAAGRLDRAAKQADGFVRREFSEWYLPLIRPRSDPAATATLAEVLRVLLPLLHPLVPVVTEEIRNHLSRILEKAPVALEDGPWPDCGPAGVDEAVDAEMAELLGIVRKARNLRSAAGGEGAADAIVRVSDEAAAEVVLGHASRIALLADLREVRVGVEVEIPEGAAAGVAGRVEVYLVLPAAVDSRAEFVRLQQEFGELIGHVRACERQLGNRDFIERAPAEVVARERSRRAGLADRILKIQQQIEVLE